MRVFICVFDFKFSVDLENINAPLLLTSFVRGKEKKQQMATDVTAFRFIFCCSTHPTGTLLRSKREETDQSTAQKENYKRSPMANLLWKPRFNLWLGYYKWEIPVFEVFRRPNRPHLATFFFWICSRRSSQLQAVPAAASLVTQSACLQAHVFFPGNQLGYYSLPFFSSCLQLDGNST